MNKLIDINECIRVRKEIVERTKAEMMGPGSEDIGADIKHEVISDSPLDRYSLGVLFPQNNLYEQDESEKEKSDNGDSEEIIEEVEKEIEKQKKKANKTKNNIQTSLSDEEEVQEEISMANQTLPSAMGLTFFAEGEVEELNIEVSCAKYRVSQFRDCVVRTDKEIDITKYLLGEYLYQEDGLVKLKKNLSRKNVFELVSGRDIQTERPDIEEILYKLADLCSSEEGRKHKGYVRTPFLENKNIKIPLNKEFNKIFINEDGKISENTGVLKVTVLRKKYEEKVFSYTVVLVNEQKVKKSYKTCFFQPEIKITTYNNNFKFIERSDIQNINSKFIDNEELVFNLLYRNKKSYAVGHGVATGQDININTGKGEIYTDFFPSFEIPQLDFEIKELGEESKEILSMFTLSDISDVSKDKKIDLLNSFANAYKEWIKKLEELGNELKEKYDEKIIEDQIKECEKILFRVRNGINILGKNKNAYDAFTLMNRSMLMQRVHSTLSGSEHDRFPGDKEMPNFDYYNIEKKAASWRAFQLAFILINIESISKPNCEERDIVDLIWIPTGGGKTEAYLGLTGFTIFLRRLKDTVNGGGTTIIMRYTLRLLAAQQFTRASILICACEKIRRESKEYNLGKEEISIGLWVGGDPTPNTNADAKFEYKELTKVVRSKEELESRKIRHNKFQILKCPWCGTKLEMEFIDGKKKGLWGYNYDKKKIIYCPESKCDFNKKLPIQVVDEELYKNPPTLLFGTVDKFAALPWKGEVSNLFALNKLDTKSPELIIQDELHLISGPLGTMVGLYETAIDAMCSAKGIKPKIIASTATIKRAKEQCKMLFDRQVSQFPPSGLNIEDCFFTKEVSIEKKPGRLYVGLMPSGKTTTTTQIRLYTALLESLRFIDAPEEVLDKYWTLVGYFNSIRELGKTSTLVKDDIASNIIRYMKRLMKCNDIRYAGIPNELTSRLSSTAIVKTLKDLENIYQKGQVDPKTNKKKDNINHAIDVLLATNMISVGVDVSRLDLMVSSGQPKQTSEYIQATSRVGRRYPGLVFTLYNASKTRDRSHYELFYPYHQTFYKYVEPTSITPFSEQSRERALHAVLISMIRHILKLNNNEDAKNFKNDIEGLDNVKEFILNRANELDTSQERDISTKTKNEIEQIIDKWIDKIDTASIDEEVHYYSKKADKNLLVPFLEDDYRNAFPTMQSMRNIDNQAGAQIIEFGDDNNEEY
ncbi:helicase [Clostridium botulinum]|uniref:helicase-related protein n=1 Tax=Clostridium botulinum TaxID=1491 RepID=UPI00037089E1|nr:helicase-related protein [Clostridium botulinum]MBN1036088.1 helicase [Clostridium botulinum]MBY7024811.1 helicase [Clostridium botulinum]NFN19712.1 helicase [Clostridium botulinum]NFN50107.1 helicase [Clostridium botulinum]